MITSCLVGKGNLFPVKLLYRTGGKGPGGRAIRCGRSSQRPAVLRARNGQIVGQSLTDRDLYRKGIGNGGSLAGEGIVRIYSFLVGTQLGMHTTGSQGVAKVYTGAVVRSAVLGLIENKSKGISRRDRSQLYQLRDLRARRKLIV